MQVSQQYEDREQTLFKHRVYSKYSESWAFKLASWGERICIVEPFSGPWDSRDPEHRDTSVYISLCSLKNAVEFWRAKGRRVSASAMFIDDDPGACVLREEIIAPFRDSIDVVALEGKFADYIAEIDQFIGASPSLTFIDSFGWQGVPMESVARLASRRNRDVMVRIPSDRANRFREAEGVADFFATDVPVDANEEGLGDLYREQLKAKSGLRYAAHMAIPYPTRDRAFFRLVVGGHHPAALQVFRDAEQVVLGREAPDVRRRAKERNREQRTGQLSMLRDMDGAADGKQVKAAREAEFSSEKMVREILGRGPSRFDEVWCEVLQEIPVTRSTVVEIVLRMGEDQEVRILGEKAGAKGRRKIRDGDRLELCGPPDPDAMSANIQRGAA